MRKSDTTIFILLILSLFVVFLACSGQNTEQLVKNFETVYNSHNVEKIMSLYADDAIFEVLNQFRFTRLEKIRGVAQYDSALDLSMTITDIEVRGDTAFFKLTERNNWFKAMGVEAAYFDPTYIIFHENLVFSLKASATMESIKAIQAAMEGFMPWAKENAPDRMAEMMPDGGLIYNAENAIKIVEVTKEFKASTKNK